MRDYGSAPTDLSNAQPYFVGAVSFFLPAGVGTTGATFPFLLNQVILATESLGPELSIGFVPLSEMSIDGTRQLPSVAAPVRIGTISIIVTQPTIPF